MLFFSFLFWLTEICVCDEEATQFTAYCDLVRLVNPEVSCPADLNCDDGFFSYNKVVATCTGSDITSLKASGVGLNSLPESLNAMTKLEILNVANNALTSLPVFGDLKALKTVYVYSNQLTTLNGVFPNSTKLEFVSANNNALTELPPEFANTNMKTFNFDNNNIENLPDEYVKMKKLVGVGMSKNKFDCSVVKQKFPKTAFETACIQAQQKTEDDVPALPTSFSTEPPNEGLDGYEITSIILFVLFIVCAAIAIVFYVRYRNGGVEA